MMRLGFWLILMARKYNCNSQKDTVTLKADLLLGVTCRVVSLEISGNLS